MVVTKEQMDAAMNPKTVAVVGAKKDADYSWLKNMTDFKGKVYSVQLDPNEIPGIEELGFDNYTSLMEIPEPIDYVVVAVPRRVAPRVLTDAIAKGVNTVHFFTSGFGESKEEEGIQLQEQIHQMATEAGILVIGPNCMGVFNPHVGMRFGAWSGRGEDWQRHHHLPERRARQFDDRGHSGQRARRQQEHKLRERHSAGQPGPAPVLRRGPQHQRDLRLH